MSSSSETGVQRVLSAALTLLARHGFHRTSMADIAREAGIARATLYLRFAGKRALLEALAAALIDQALTAAEAAWVNDAPLSQNIAATLLAKDLSFFRLLNTTPHGAELLELDAELTAEYGTRLDTGFSNLLRRRGAIAMRAGADLSVFGGAKGFASFLATTAAGLKHATSNEDAYRSAIEQLGRITAKAAGVS